MEQNEKSLKCRIEELEACVAELKEQTVEHPAQEICTNIRSPYVSPRTSWWGGWTPVATGNVPRAIVVPWRTISQRTNETGKAVDFKVTLDWGDHLIFNRRNRVYLWNEFRVLVNGTAVITRTYEDYWYKDERNDNNPLIVPPVQYDIQPMGTSMYNRYNVPLAALVEVQVQSRWQVAAAQQSSYARYIGGLRSHASIDWTLRDIVIGRL